MTHSADYDAVALTEQACEVMHDAYEAAAVTAGWETQQQSRKPWADVPEANKATMRAAVAALLEWLQATRVIPPGAWRGAVVNTNDAPTCQCVSLMDTSKCPVHGTDRWNVPRVQVRHCASCTCGEERP